MSNRLLFNIASVLYIVVGLVHLFLHFLAKPELSTQEQELLYSLMHEYRFDWGAGIVRSMSDIQSAFFLYMTIFLFGLAILNLIVLRHAQKEKLVMHSITLNFIVMVFITGITVWRAYLIPLIMYGLCFLFIFIPFIRQLTKPVS